MNKIIQVSINKVKRMNWKRKEKRYLAEFKNPVSRAKRRHEIERCFKMFFKNVQIRKCLNDSHDVFVVCSGIYLNRGNQKNIIGYDHHFETETDKAYTIYHFIYAHFFCRYGVMPDDPSECDGRFSFHIYYAYRKGGNHRCRF